MQQLRNVDALLGVDTREIAPGALDAQIFVEMHRRSLDPRDAAPTILVRNVAGAEAHDPLRSLFADGFGRLVTSCAHDVTRPRLAIPSRDGKLRGRAPDISLPSQRKDSCARRSPRTS